MKTIWYVAKKDLLQTIKDRGSIFFTLVMPMIFITVMGLTLGNAFGDSGPITVTVAISNQDTGFVGQTIGKYLAVEQDRDASRLAEVSLPTSRALWD